MDEKIHGGAWSIQPREKTEKPKTRRRVHKTVHIQEMILKELLKPRTVTIEKEMLNVTTQKTETVRETVKKPTILLILSDLTDSMVLNNDVRIKAMGIKLLCELLKTTEDLIYHPSVIAKIDIDQLTDNQDEKDQFLALLQKANQKLQRELPE